MAQQVEVDKQDIGTATLATHDLPTLADGAARLKVESFAVTANNVTYAVIGDLFKYWNFFPASGEGLGIVPMWGHAVVEQSNAPALAVGERVYGYLPMGSHVDVVPGGVTPSGFVDESAHRAPMAAVYNQYSRLSADPEHDPAREDARMIFGPLFKTGFLIEAMFRREAWFGATQLLITSASSKTALALAHVARAKSPDIRRIGLTSAGNVDFVRETGLYDAVIAYDAVSTLDRRPSVAVDMAGNAAVLAAYHEHLGGMLQYSTLVGATHVEARDRGGGGPTAGPKPELFFAPDHVRATVKQLGVDGFSAAMADRWRAFLADAGQYVRAEHREGMAAARDAYLETVAGRADPAVGIVIRP